MRGQIQGKWWLVVRLEDNKNKTTAEERFPPQGNRKVGTGLHLMACDEYELDWQRDEHDTFLFEAACVLGFVGPGVLLALFVRVFPEILMFRGLVCWLSLTRLLKIKPTSDPDASRIILRIFRYHHIETSFRHTPLEKESISIRYYFTGHIRISITTCLVSFVVY